MPALGVADSVAADEVVCQMLGADADSGPTVLDIIEGLVVLVLRQGSVVNDCCSPLTTSILQKVLLAMQQTWMPRDFTHVSDDARDVSARRASVLTRQDSATDTMEPQEQKPALVIRDSCENVGNTAPVESPLLMHRLAFALDRAQTCSADTGQMHKVLTDAQSVVSLLPFAHTDSTTAVFECDGHETWIRDSLSQKEHLAHNARATVARSTNVSLDDIRVGVRRAFVVSSGCLSGSVVRDSDKCDFARQMDATVTCIESLG